MKKFYLSLLAGLTLACANQETEKTPEPAAFNATQYVDPFIGTGDHGHTYPGATVPFGMVQLSPDNGTQGWDWCSGYNYADSVIVGFSHTHLSGTGIGDLADLSIMPVLGEHDLKNVPSEHKEKSWATPFSHDNEEASPGYYSVKLDNGINIELTATERVGVHRYNFQEGNTASFILDLDFAINWDKPLSADISVESPTLIVGHRNSQGWAKDQRLYYAMEFSAPVETFIEGNRALITSTDSEVLIKVGISSANVEGAKLALNEVPDWDFNRVRSEANENWNTELSKVAVESGDDDLKTQFYTSLYHTMVAPVLYEDSNGNYKGADSLVHQASDYTRYDIFSLWDTFRAENPLLTITKPDMVNDIVNSLLAHYDEYGLLPVWSLLGNETNTMTGYHAIPVIADAYLKGFDGFDIDKAYEAMIKSSMQDIRGTNHYREFGYIPYDKDGQSVTKTLEYAYDDWCIAQVAKKLGKEDDYREYMRRSAFYRNLFDEGSGFMRAKMADGTWKTPFDPKYSSHDFSIAEYTEGNAWQHSWFVPHDIAGLIELHGGNDKFSTMLDSLFNETSEISGDFVSADISGLIGQYAHGNEPSHHIAYMYNYAGHPWKTQKIVDEIVHTMYTSEPTGLCGNEDCGQMSAWYVFSVLGFYPVNPAEGVYVIGSPQFEEATLNVGDESFKVVAKGVTDDAKYIQGATLNGEQLNRSYITHREILAGGTLEFTMGSEPNMEWATNADDLPKSMSNN